MNFRCPYQQRSFVAACEEREKIESMICPKPRRLGNSNFNPSAAFHEPIRPQRLSLNRQTDMGDSNAGAELLDMILAKGRGEKINTQVASSPPYFSGSPPCRASNPVVQDARFGDERTPPTFYPAGSPSPSSRLSGGCTRTKFGHSPAAVRVEGFDCYSRDRHSISAMA
ncbi:hypothetical protein ACFE04_009446 [Oxalis oulophora]